jgi:hypothetical protein
MFEQVERENITNHADGDDVGDETITLVDADTQGVAKGKGDGDNDDGDEFATPVIKVDLGHIQNECATPLININTGMKLSSSKEAQTLKKAGNASYVPFTESSKLTNTSAGSDVIGSDVHSDTGLNMTYLDANDVGKAMTCPSYDAKSDVGQTVAYCQAKGNAGQTVVASTGDDVHSDVDLDIAQLMTFSSDDSYRDENITPIVFMPADNPPEKKTEALKILFLPDEQSAAEKKSPPSHCQYVTSHPSHSQYVTSDPSHTQYVTSDSSHTQHVTSNPSHTPCVTPDLSPLHTQYVTSDPSPSHTQYVTSS